MAYDRRVTTGGSDAPSGAAIDPTERPLSATQLQTLARAEARLGSFRRAGALAAFNGWTLAGCAALCVPLALADVALLFVGLGLGVAAWAELRGRSLMRVADARAPSWLAYNQLCSFLIVFGYCAWRVYAGLSGPNPSEAPGVAELLDFAGGDEAMADAIDRIYPIALAGFYSVILLACAAYQGGCALYYLGRREAIAGYLAETPAWVREIQSAIGQLP